MPRELLTNSHPMKPVSPAGRAGRRSAAIVPTCRPSAAKAATAADGPARRRLPATAAFRRPLTPSAATWATSGRAIAAWRRAVTTAAPLPATSPSRFAKSPSTGADRSTGSATCWNGNAAGLPAASLCSLCCLLSPGEAGTVEHGVEEQRQRATPEQTEVGVVREGDDLSTTHRLADA